MSNPYNPQGPNNPYGEQPNPYGQQPPAPYGQPGYPTTPQQGYPPQGYPQAPQPGAPMYAPPSTPMYAPPGMPGGSPFQPAKKRNPLIVIGALVGVLVVAFGAFAIVGSLNKDIYSNSLTGDVSGWPSRDGCAPASDGYHVKADVSCFAPTDDITDFDMTVTAKAVGTDTTQPYGVTFRSAETSNDEIGDTYVVLISNDGSWALAKLIGGNATALGQSTTPNAAIHQDGSANNIEVKDKGKTITLKVNGTQLISIDDVSLSKGLVGLQGFDGGEVVFTNIKITKV